MARLVCLMRMELNVGEFACTCHDGTKVKIKFGQNEPEERCRQGISINGQPLG